ncbi:orotidine 5'-phosphate decarboxylase [Candidatus Nomurabacteria bacterium]|nr:orotidine 5'-phosphate decarboxylase [Candidatus Nomurabacteria bacterium]MCB9827311.1 orotidine 5'-phosphate decarboxylase [Candidatus Nomurabacteria bacterium]HXK52403.1 orotidine 5'-phosphate decarboxylase [bacterium]
MNRGKIQIAFNYTFNDFAKVIRYIPKNPNIILEAGTPLIKYEGIKVISKMRSLWSGEICADMKIADGAHEEVLMAKQAGATSVTVLGNSSVETLKIFVDSCTKLNITSIVDMISNEKPLKTLWKANVVPEMVYIHRGRDEENSFGKILQYKDISMLKGKWDLKAGAAGGMDKRELQSAIFNSADVVVVNIVRPSDSWKGIVFDSQFRTNLEDFLRFVA